MDARSIPAVLLLVVCCACTSGSEPTATATTAPSNLLQPTATFTAFPLPQASTATPQPADYSGGEIELIITFQVDETVHECTSRFPFTLTRELDPPRINGEGVIDCHFTDVLEGDGGSVTSHTLLQYSGQVDGLLYPGTSSKPAGFLDTSLALDGSFREYYSDYPDGAIVPFTETNPFVIEGADLVPLPFEWKEGSTVVITPPTAGASANRWTYILHLH